jgi:redox-sensitive bicupin YhaK (pirin superfamily)
MIYIRKNQDRGHSQINWLNSLHTFSFANYHDEKFMGYYNLRVINEDTVQPGFGFGKHPHDNMEIISYVVQGSLEHKDSMGTGSVIQPGEIQIMSAGTGVEHSEFNHSKTDTLHFLQIWIIPEEINLQPKYQQKKIQQEKDKWILIAAREESEHVVKINQDVFLYAAFLTKEKILDYVLPANRAAWLQLISGKIKLNNQQMSAGDGAAIQNENIRVECVEDAEFLFFDLSTF